MGGHDAGADPGEPSGVAVAATRSGLRIRLPASGDFAAALADLNRALGEVGRASGAAVTVDAAGRVLDVAQLREIETLLRQRHGVAVLQVMEGQREATPGARGRGRASRRRGGSDRRVDIRERPPAESPAEEVPLATPAAGAAVLARARTQSAPPAAVALDMTPTLLVRRTLRSGQRVRFNGNVVVLGDVNPGAEIVASGDIVVLGTLRGVAHAGATGSAEAIVMAFRLQPMQLRVGSVIGRAPDGQPARADAPEIARLRDGALLIERYLSQGLD